MLIFALRTLFQYIKGSITKPKLSITPTTIIYDVQMRAWPIDLDMFMHINNASYVRIAELARWRVMPSGGNLQGEHANPLFLAVEQNVKYYKPISPFKSYIVRTCITSTDNKWIHYRHIFQQTPSLDGIEPLVYCEVYCKAVLKQRNGKTIKISEVSQYNDFYKYIK